MDEGIPGPQGPTRKGTEGADDTRKAGSQYRDTVCEEEWRIRRPAVVSVIVHYYLKKN